MKLAAAAVALLCLYVACVEPRTVDHAAGGGGSDASGGSAGSAGGGGAPGYLAFDGAECLSCLPSVLGPEGICRDLYVACDSDPACRAALDCYWACYDGAADWAACSNSCRMQFPAWEELLAPYLGCVCCIFLAECAGPCEGSCAALGGLPEAPAHCGP